MSYVARKVDNLDILLSGTGSATSSYSSSSPSPNPSPTTQNNDTEFKPWLVVVGIVLIAGIWFFFWGKRKLERMTMMQPVDNGTLGDEPGLPKIFDAHIYRVLEGRSSWSWRDIQPLSLEQSRRQGLSHPHIRRSLPRIYSIFEKRRDTTTDQLPDLTGNQKDGLLCVSTVIAMPLESRNFHSTGEIAEVRRTEIAGASREGGTSDAVGRDKLDLMIGVALVPLTHGVK